MITCEELFAVFNNNNFNYFTGVPDSTFKPWMSFLDDMNGRVLTNRITAIERDAIGFASGYHVATGKAGVVYMQNSGLGNTVNPLTSLADHEVYNMPMLLMVGWRAEPGTHDEPQHVKMGKVTIPLLDVLGIRHGILSDNIVKAANTIRQAREYLEQKKGQYALIIKSNTIAEYKSSANVNDNYELTREAAIKTIIDSMDGSEIISATTGKTSRELFEYRESKGQGHQNDFLMVGSMGLASAFGAELALQKPDRKIFIFDGDGAAIMSMGNLSVIGYYAPKNLYHILFDNAAHESTGGQPTTSPATDFCALALANKYQGAQLATNQAELAEAIKIIKTKPGPQMLVVKIKTGSRSDLGRPTATPAQNKEALMQFLK